jgi:choline dehydrogenase
VEFRQEGATFAARAAGEVILSSGAVGSPQTLSCSGIGPAARLRDHGIPVMADLPGVGENLQDHVALRMLFKVKDTITLNQQAATLFGKAKMALQYALLRKGPLTIPPALVSAFTRSSPDQATPNVQFVAYPVSFDKVGDAPHPYPGFTASACLLNPFSRGHVRIASPDPMAAPKIQLNFLTDERDLDIAAGAMRAVRRAISGPALARFAPQEMQPGVTAQTDDELKDAARRYGMTIFHPVGTCRMGNDANAVVDARLRVHGIGGLRVVDASVMPTITSGNTNAPTIMIAEKAADMILQDRRSAA